MKKRTYIVIERGIDIFALDKMYFTYSKSSPLYKFLEIPLSKLENRTDIELQVFDKEKQIFKSYMDNSYKESDTYLNSLKIYNGDFIYDGETDIYKMYNNPDLTLRIDSIEDLSIQEHEKHYYLEKYKDVKVYNLIYMHKEDILYREQCLYISELDKFIIYSENYSDRETVAYFGYSEYIIDRLNKIFNKELINYEPINVCFKVNGGYKFKDIDITMYKRVVSLYKLGIDIIDRNKVYIEMYKLIDTFFKNLIIKDNAAVDENNTVVLRGGKHKSDVIDIFIRMDTIFNDSISIYDTDFRNFRYKVTDVNELLYHYIQINKIDLIGCGILSW